MRFWSREERQGVKRGGCEGCRNDDGVRRYEMVPRPGDHAIIQDVHQGARIRPAICRVVPIVMTPYTLGHRCLGSWLHPCRNAVWPPSVPWSRLQPPTGTHPRRHRHAYSRGVLRHHIPPLSRLHPIVAHPQAAPIHRAVSSSPGRSY